MPSVLFVFTKVADFLRLGWGVFSRILHHAKREVREARGTKQ